MKRFVPLVLMILFAAAACENGGTVDISPPTTAAPQGPTTTQQAPQTTQPPTTQAPTTQPPTTTTTTTQAPTTTQAATTTAAPTTSTTSPPPATTTTIYLVDPANFFPPKFPGNQGGHGSGCYADPGVLPDGVWFGYPLAVAGGMITFDLACFYTGAEANAEAAADGESTPVPNDYYIRNFNPLTFAVPIAAGASAWYLDPISLQPTEIPASTWPTAASFYATICPGEYCSIWIYVNGGEATDIVEQFLP